MRVLFIGDVVGGPGRAGSPRRCPRCASEHEPDLVIANGENSAGGVGITERTANDLFGAGVDLLTTGNHVYRQRDAYEYIDREERLVRPANYPKGNPGRGSLIIEVGGPQGRAAQPERGAAADASRARRSRPPTPSSRELERRGAEVVHRRLPRRGDEREDRDGLAPRRPGRGGRSAPTPTCRPPTPGCCPAGTAFVCDVGMTGSRQSVLGVEVEDALGRFRDPDADPLPDRRGGRLDQRRRLRRGRRRPRDIDHTGDPAGSLSVRASHGGLALGLDLIHGRGDRADLGLDMRVDPRAGCSRTDTDRATDARHGSAPAADPQGGVRGACRGLRDHAARGSGGGPLRRCWSPACSSPSPTGSRNGSSGPSTGSSPPGSARRR